MVTSQQKATITISNHPLIYHPGTTPPPHTTPTMVKPDISTFPQVIESRNA